LRGRVWKGGRKKIYGGQTSDGRQGRGVAWNVTID